MPSEFPLVEIESDIQDAVIAIDSAIDEIVCDDDMTEEEFRNYLKAVGLADLYVALTAARRSIKEAWEAPDLKARLKREWEEYDDQADRAEAQMY